MPTIVLRCKCNHDFQDRQFGKGMRLHNIMYNGLRARCTVCTSVNDIPKTAQGGGQNVSKGGPTRKK